MTEATGGEPAIEVADLRVERGGREVLHGLDLQVPSGAIVGLLGPSGCGKSTLIRSIVGVQERVRGTCRVLGLPAGAPSLRRRVGYLTQSPAVYADLSVFENLRYFAAVAGVDGTRVQAVLDDVGLAEQAREVVAELSGGQRSRVSLAIALLAVPDLLVLDEPTVGLDPLLRRDLWELFHRFAARGTTLLVSSHVMEEASQCDRLLLLREGHLIADDTEAGLLARTGAPDVEGAFIALVEDRS